MKFGNFPNSAVSRKSIWSNSIHTWCLIVLYIEPFSMHSTLIWYWPAIHIQCDIPSNHIIQQVILNYVRYQFQSTRCREVCEWGGKRRSGGKEYYKAEGGEEEGVGAPNDDDGHPTWRERGRDVWPMCTFLNFLPHNHIYAPPITPSWWPLQQECILNDRWRQEIPIQNWTIFRLSKMGVYVWSYKYVLRFRWPYTLRGNGF